MENASSGEEFGRDVARQGRRGGEDAARDGTGTGRALVEAEDAEEIRGDAGGAVDVVTRARVRELSERLDGLIEEGRRRAVELGGVSGLVVAAGMAMIGLSGSGAGYLWLAPPAGLAVAGIPWASWRWRLRKLPPPPSEAPPSLDQELGALRERFDAFMPSPGELSATMTKFVAGILALMGPLSVVVLFGLWSVGEASLAIGAAVAGLGFSLTALLMYRLAKHFDRAGALGKEIAASSRGRDRSLGRGGSAALGERLALENELDELRSERKKWLQVAAAWGGGSVAYPFIMGDIGGPGDLVGHVVFALVFVVVLMIPVVRKQSRMRELEARLDGVGESGATGEPPGLEDG